MIHPHQINLWIDQYSYLLLRPVEMQESQRDIISWKAVLASSSLGLKTCVGNMPSQNPDSIVVALAQMGCPKALNLIARDVAINVIWTNQGHRFIRIFGPFMNLGLHRMCLGLSTCFALLTLDFHDLSNL